LIKLINHTNIALVYVGLLSAQKFILV